MRMWNDSQPRAMERLSKLAIAVFVSLTLAPTGFAGAAELQPVTVDGQPLAANVNRVLQSLDTLGTPLPNETVSALTAAAKARDAAQLQRLLDPHVLLVVSLNPES